MKLVPSSHARLRLRSSAVGGCTKFRAIAVLVLLLVASQHHLLSIRDAEPQGEISVSLRQLRPAASSDPVQQLQLKHSATTIITRPLAASQGTGGQAQCICELISVDCLHSLECMESASRRHLHNGNDVTQDDAIGMSELSFVLTKEQRYRIAMGVATRMAIKRSATVDASVSSGRTNHVMPPGKSTQYLAIRSWQRWSQQQSVRARYDLADSYIDHTKHEGCVPDTNATTASNGVGVKGGIRKGKSCFFHDWNEPEEFETMEELSWGEPLSKRTAAAAAADGAGGGTNTGVTQEQSTNRRRGTITDAERQKMIELANSDIQGYLLAAQGRRMWTDTIHALHNASASSESPLSGSRTISPLADLLAFCHILLIRFNRRPMVHSYYDDHVKTIPAKQSAQRRKPFPVSLHMRRADSCDHKARHKYQPKASPLDSIPQVSGQRMCYATQVYLQALEVIERKVQRPLEVYVSTDYAGTVLTEIEEEFPQIFHRTTWKVIEVSRETFQYKGYVEDAFHQHAQLGQSAYADLWHLSHGQAFVGHLGSRFGKISYYLATARYNTFIPFQSVDGHSVCCEIDESCAKVAPYITSVENCFSFAHESLVQRHKDYWRSGSAMREEIATNVQKQKQLAGYGGWLA